jgi:hypothetical protein
MKALFALFALSAAAVAPGCGDGDSTTAPETGDLVVYARTGGFASSPQRLTIAADGSATVEAGVPPGRTTFTLGHDDLAALRAELDRADFDAVDGDSPTSCADCYVFRITYGGRTIGYDESQPVPDSVATVVAHLDRLTAEHPPAQAQPPIVN